MPASVLLVLAVCTALALLLGLDAWISMALHAVLEIGDALLHVLSAHLGRRMFVVAIAGVAAEFVVPVTGRAFRVVVTVQHEQLVVIQGGRLPAFLAMTALIAAAQAQLSAKLGNSQ